MSDKYFAKKINLHVNEELVAILHHHPITYAKQIAVTAVLILGSFFFMFLLFSLGEIGVALFCALLLTGVIYGCREFYIWYANVCVVTNQRLVDIDQSGIFQKTVSDIDFGKIVDISYSVKGVRQTIFNIGSIKVQASGATLLLKNIKEPGKVNQLLVDLIRKKTGKEMEVKKVVNVGPQTKDKIMAEFVNQDEMDQFEEYNLQELLEEYKETFGELSLKKLLVEELEAEEDVKVEAEKPEKLSPKTEVEEIEGNFRKKRL
jgi:hypothetical protein